MVELAAAIVLPVAGGGSAEVGLAWLNDRRHAARQRSVPALDPKAILDSRFASGEIDELEYTRRVQLWSTGPPLELEDPPYP